MVKMTPQDGKLHCAFEGSLNTMTCLELEKDLYARIREAKLPVVFDMSKVDFITSAFLRICLTVYKETGPENLAIINMQPSVKTVFNIAGFSELIPGM